MEAEFDALRRFRYIVVEGPIGAGKTSLANKLAQRLGADVMTERPADNPFLERFYADNAGYALQTQLFFLFQRLRQVRELAQPGMFTQGLVSDFMFEKDALFARLTLSDEEYRLYAQMVRQLAPQIPRPDLVLWLQAGPQTLLGRIHRRGLAMERGITLAYLQRLCDAYAEHFQRYDGAPVFALDTEHFNPIEREADFALLVQRLAAFHGRREWLVAPGEAADGGLYTPARPK